MKKITIALIVAAASLTLSGCAPEHATVQDCIDFYAEQGKPLEGLAETCTNIYLENDADEFDRLFG